MSKILQTKENQITQAYGNGHGGIDIVGQNSALDNIVAHSDGIVVFCQTGLSNDTKATGNASYGNCVKIKHDNGYYTLYAHLKSVKVQLNEKVKARQILGEMGDTGLAFGAHIHFEVRDTNDVKIDPTQYINSELSPIQSEVVRKWQHAMNLTFNSGLEEDNKYGPISKAETTKNNIKQGAKGEIVKWLQERLIELGFSCGPHGIDGSFGPDTHKAVIEFQKSRGILVDGIVGLQTVTELVK